MFVCNVCASMFVLWVDVGVDVGVGVCGCGHARTWCVYVCTPKCVPQSVCYRFMWVNRCVCVCMCEHGVCMCACKDGVLLIHLSHMTH